MKRIKILLVAFFLLFYISEIKALSTNVVDFKKLGSINITLLEKEDNIKIEGAEITLYKIANAKEEAHNLIFEYVDELSNCNLSIESLKAEDVSKCITKDITGIKKITSAEGVVYFDELDLGLYLVKQTNRVSGFSKIDPFLVIIPSEIDNKWIYDIESEPKTDIIRTIDLSVKKVWNTTKTNNNDSISLPKSIDIQLLLNDEIIDTVTLSEENNWQYTFSNIEKNDNYVVREVNVPNGYTVTYQKDGNLFIVTNTSSLVHTGQMYWLVGLFLSIGIIFIITSLLYDRNKNEQKG